MASPFLHWAAMQNTSLIFLLVDGIVWRGRFKSLLSYLDRKISGLKFVGLQHAG
jgi:hypothetical protein